MDGVGGVELTDQEAFYHPGHEVRSEEDQLDVVEE